VTPEHAADLLGLSMTGLTLEAVKTAFRTKVLNLHPDTGATLDVEADMALLRQAKTLLERYVSHRGIVCPACDGKGKFPSGWSVATCPKCHGEGVIV